MFLEQQNQYIQMISEGSRDTEDRSNDEENSALRHRNKWHFTIYYNWKHFKLYKYFIILLFYCNQTDEVLVKKRDFFQKHFKISQTLNFLTALYIL